MRIHVLTCCEEEYREHMCPGSRSTGEHTPLEGDGEDAVHGVDDEEEVPDHPLLVELQGGALGPNRVKGAALGIINQRYFRNTITDEGMIIVGRGALCSLVYNAVGQRFFMVVYRGRFL